MTNRKSWLFGTLCLLGALALTVGCGGDGGGTDAVDAAGDTMPPDDVPVAPDVPPADVPGSEDSTEDIPIEPDLQGPDVVEDELLRLTLLQTSDLHHRASGYGPFADYTPLDSGDLDEVTGGYARLAALIGSIRTEQAAADVPVLVVDSGDFTMGTVYDMTGADPLAFAFFQAVGYDVITFGNHEFDWGPGGLAMLIGNALAADPAFAVPIVASNTLTDPVDPVDDALETLFTAGVIADRLVLELPNGLRVGFVGNMGNNADDDAPPAPPVTFDHEAEHLQPIVDALRTEDGAHVVVALSHAGLDDDLDSGEDVRLAGNVTGLDVVASGHSHLATPDAIAVGDAVVFQPGSYGRWLARLDLTYNLTQGRVEETTFTLLPVDDSTGGDATVQQLVDDAKTGIDAGLTAALGLTCDTPVAELDFSMPRAALAESGIGNLCADGVRASATMAVANTADPTPFVAAVAPNGVIRDDLRPDGNGHLTFADVFGVLPLGMSPDPANQNVPGWPMIAAYLTAAELKVVADIPISGAPILGNSVYLNFSGIRYEYDPAGPFFDRIRKIWVCGNALPVDLGGDGDFFSETCETELDLTDTVTLYRTAIDLYSLLMLPALSSLDLDVVPKHADGAPIDLTDPASYMAARIDMDGAADGVQELKNWATLLTFIGNLPDTGGDPALANIPEAVYGADGSALGRRAVISK